MGNGRPHERRQRKGDKGVRNPAKATCVKGDKERQKETRKPGTRPWPPGNGRWHDGRTKVCCGKLLDAPSLNFGVLGAPERLLRKRVPEEGFRSERSRSERVPLQAGSLKENTVGCMGRSVPDSRPPRASRTHEKRVLLLLGIPAGMMFN